MGHFSMGINGTYFRMLDEYLLHDIYKYLFDGVMKQLMEKTECMKYLSENYLCDSFSFDERYFIVRMVRFRLYWLSMRLNGG
jgi:hypothetical protein